MDALIELCHTFPAHDKPNYWHDRGNKRLSVAEVNIIIKACPDAMRVWFKWSYHYSDTCFHKPKGYRGFPRPVYFKRLGLIMLAFCFTQSFGQCFKEITVVDLQGHRKDLTYLFRWDPEVVARLSLGIPFEERWSGYSYNLYEEGDRIPIVISEKEGYEQYGIVLPELLAHHERRLERIEKETKAATILQRWWGEVMCRPAYPRTKMPGLHFKRAMERFTISLALWQKEPYPDAQRRAEWDSNSRGTTSTAHTFNYKRRVKDVGCAGWIKKKCLQML